MNTSTTAYNENYTSEDVRKYAEELLKDPDLCLLSLGAYGGYITVGLIIQYLTFPDNMISKYMATRTMTHSGH